MNIETSFPFDNKKTVKNIIFGILTKEYPLKLIQLTNYIKKRYGISVTFQAVRKAVLQLIEDDILKQEGKEFLINKEWVKRSKEMLSDLHIELTKKKSKSDTTKSIDNRISVFEFESINKMMSFWQEIIVNWHKGFKKGDYGINCYQAAHAWEGLLHLDKEHKVMSKLKEKGIKSYLLTTGNTNLDKSIIKFYKKIGLKTKIAPSASTFDRSFYIGTYGKTIIQCQYPKEIVDKLDSFFKRNKELESLDLTQLSKIVNTKCKVKLTIINDRAMAEQINKSILNSFKQ